MGLVELKGNIVTVDCENEHTAKGIFVIFNALLDGIKAAYGDIQRPVSVPTPSQPEPQPPSVPEKSATPESQEPVVAPPQQFSMEEKVEAAKAMGAAYEALGIGRSDEDTLLRVNWALFMTNEVDKAKIFASVPMMRSITVSLKRLYDEVPKQLHKEIPAAMQESMDQQMGLNLIIEGFQLKAKEKEVKKQAKK